MDIILGILEQGMIHAIMALGLYITYRILDFPDLTVDGSFPLGAAVTVMLMTSTDSYLVDLLTLGQNPYAITFISCIAGAFAGLATGIIHVKLKVRDLLSGIITMTALYSINLHIAGKANVPIFNMHTIFRNDVVDKLYPVALSQFKVLIIISIVTIGAKVLLDLYLKTKSGYLLRAVGNNVLLVTSLAKDNGNVKILGLIIANTLVALSGSVMAQQQGFFEISMGTGAMVLGLASVIIGTNMFKKVPSVKSTTAVIIGSVVYKACISFAMDVSAAVLIAAVVAVVSVVFIKGERIKKITMIVASTLIAYTIGMLIPYEITASDIKLITSVLFLIILIAGNDIKKKVQVDVRT